MMFAFGGFRWIGMIICLLITIGLIVGLVWLAIAAFRRTGESNTQPKTQNIRGQSAREIAAARYARSEISREEYQQILSDIDR